MIDHLAPKFRSESLAHSAVHEPRAAFLVNRFSKTLPVLYATHAAQLVLGCDPDQAVGRSFYEFVDGGYLYGAVNAIENAKKNDSIAYLRILWKTTLEPITDDDIMQGRVGDVDDNDDEADEEVMDEHQSPGQHRRYPQTGSTSTALEPIPDDCLEVECLISASSDGLIVVIRRAPPLEGYPPNVRPPGIFASPWSPSPWPPFVISPPPPPTLDLTHHPPVGELVESIPSLPRPAANMVLETAPVEPGPSGQDVMNSIQDVSVFAWSIAMLNEGVSDDNVNNMVDGEVYLVPGSNNVRASPSQRRPGT
jgi:hypothetical protein